MRVRCRCEHCGPSTLSLIDRVPRTLDGGCGQPRVTEPRVPNAPDADGGLLLSFSCVWLLYAGGAGVLIAIIIVMIAIIDKHRRARDRHWRGIVTVVRIPGAAVVHGCCITVVVASILNKVDQSKSIFD